MLAGIMFCVTLIYEMVNKKTLNQIDSEFFCYEGNNDLLQ